MTIFISSRTIASVAIVVSSLWLSYLCAEGFSRPSSSFPQKTSLHRTSALHGGVGVANTYSWREEQFEIEVTIPVPPKTSASNIKFKCSSESIDLRLNGEKDGGKILLDGARKTRGKICVDGTFWSIADATSLPQVDGENPREITITIEKHFVPISTIGGQQTYDAVTDFDWGGVYPNDEEEVTHREYEEPEELNVREYAAKLGVDIDNLDMSKVDKTMFGSGLSGVNNPLEDDDGQDTTSSEAVSNQKNGLYLDIEQAALDQLTRSGLAKEIVRQGDGSEYSLEDESEFSMLGKDILSEELREAGIVTNNRPVGNNVPDVWKDSSVPVEEVPGYQKTYDVADDGIIVGDIVESEISVDDDDDSIGDMENVNVDNEVPSESSMTNVIQDKQGGDQKEGVLSSNDADPIDKLTVAKLKEISKAQGLKQSGTKQVLRDRLRTHVDNLLQQEE